MAHSRGAPGAPQTPWWHHGQRGYFMWDVSFTAKAVSWGVTSAHRPGSLARCEAARSIPGIHRTVLVGYLPRGGLFLRAFYDNRRTSAICSRPKIAWAARWESSALAQVGVGAGHYFKIFFFSFRKTAQTVKTRSCDNVQKPGVGCPQLDAAKCTFFAGRRPNLAAAGQKCQYSFISQQPQRR